MLGLDNDRPANGFSAVMDDKRNGSTFGGGTVEDGNDFATPPIVTGKHKTKKA